MYGCNHSAIRRQHHLPQTWIPIKILRLRNLSWELEAARAALRRKPKSVALSSYTLFAAATLWGPVVEILLKVSGLNPPFAMMLGRP